MATSTIPAFKAAFLAVLQARAGLKGVTVTGTKIARPGAEWVWLRGTRGTQRAAALGQQRREETYKLEVIENALRADASVGGVVRTATVADEFLYDEVCDERQCEGRVTLHVACAARI
jgi:hypothetical protein